ncbi:MAG: hypothetical protein UW22_C0032G0002 [Candidatus Gottesmanbacteria bacterium GW2011_GWB1_44_11c]|uniref:DUF5678 domain-containing protein n=2 Tax=Candidatus Gottesmaniibacteriota TaxID=1752720 RepID=A0A0G1LH03_9BACT|nr:MAG: hypothetical protein UW22_C0032G0002 [Candidatus Gottesmanbacteria bacterium GW2011_GWB1_44_11c]KKT59239.1 MAG: hypothetical protein UW52_C0044G0002 [Candidatus Gottesmanbacteria bacterium GW2011_GWA1_44_24b]HCM82360.1 hypothetical protein [Patescibacteria group bacterium]
MKRVNISVKYMGKFAGKWVAINTIKDRIVAVGETLKEIEPFITRSVKDKTPDEKIAAAFKVPRKDEGPYVLCIRKIRP